LTDNVDSVIAKHVGLRISSAIMIIILLLRS